MGNLVAILPMPNKPRVLASSIEADAIGLYEDAERRLHRQALAQSGEAVVIANAKGVIEYVNAAFEEIAGYSAEEAIGQRPSILKSGEHDNNFYAGLWATLRKGRSFRGVFINRNKNGTLYHEEKTISPIMNQAGCVTHFVSTGHNVDARIAAERKLHQLAYYDTLTGLPNRKLFLQRLESCLAPDTRTSDGIVLLLDINNLKRINDTLGHAAGDQALRVVASRLESFCQSASSVARSGGDEFIMMVKVYGAADLARTITQSVLDILGHPFNLGKHEVFLSASIGIARFPQDARDPEDLLRHADLALHQAKEAGRNVYRFYQDAMRDTLHEDLQIETALHGALEHNELSLAFQPIVRSPDRVMVGLEALLRWESATLGTVSPARFIPQMERSGLIIPVGRWVLETACCEIVGMRHSEVIPLHLAVNVSARQLLHPNFVADVKAALEKSTLAPQLLELEITESVLIENAAVAADVLRKLRLLGVRIAADDFGTGYSSLSYLWKFPFDTLKIDRSFVAEMNDDPQVRTIVKSILNLARDLGFWVVAEGVETELQFEILERLGCPFIQGYWTGRPLPIAEIKALPAVSGHTKLGQ